MGTTSSDLAVLDALYADSAERISALDADLEIYHAQRAELAGAEQAIQRTGWTPERAAALDRAKQQYDSLRVALIGAQRTLRRDALTAINRPEEDIQRLERTISNRDRAVPGPFRCLDLGSETWTLVERAHRKLRRNVPLTPAEASAYQSCASHPEVLLARSRLDANLADLEAAMQDSEG